MSVLLPAWLCLLLGLLAPQVQSRAVTQQNLAQGHRWSLPRAFRYPKPSYTTTTPAASDLPVAMHDHIALGDGRIIWRAWQHKGLPLLVQSDGVPQAPPAGQRESRRRRHANSGGSRGHGHLMRVGCVLGTCQVQNLSHRLYQLIGHSGREDSSPINPHSPHSYG